MKTKLALLCSGVIFALLLDCTGPTQTAGGASGTEVSGKVAVIKGTIVYANSSPVASATVILRPNDVTVPANTPTDSILRRRSADTLTGNDGTFTFNNIDTGSFSIEVWKDDSLAVLNKCTISKGTSLVELTPDTLKPCATITGGIPPLYKDSIQISIPGLSRSFTIDSLGRFTIRVPTGSYSLHYVYTNSLSHKDIELPPVYPGSRQDIGFFGTFTQPENIPCLSSNCDSVTLKIFLRECGLDSTYAESCGIWNNGRITGINLKNKGISILSPLCTRFPFLDSIDLGQNMLYDPFRQLFACTTLTILRIDHCGLRFLPMQIDRLKKLHVLDVGHNDLDVLPITIVNINPASVNLENNRLANITGETVEWANTHDPNWFLSQRSPPPIQKGSGPDYPQGFP